MGSACLFLLSLAAHAESPSLERVQTLCASVDSPSQCGRAIEAEQIKALPDLAKRDGDTLTVKLYPSGARLFVDTITGSDERSYALWDYWSPVNAVVLFITSGDDLGWAILQRATGQLTTLPAEPVLAPDRQHVAVADFCARNCTNELTVWRVSRDGVRKELGYRPDAAWSDVTATWKNPDTLVVEYTPPGASAASKVDRKLTAPDWKPY